MGQPGGEEIRFDIDLGPPLQRDSHKVYPIRTTTNHPRFPTDYSDYNVTRRYNDFELLRDRLVALQPWCVVPPLPPKEGVTGAVCKMAGQKSDQFLSSRQRRLRMFLQRVGASGELSEVPVFVEFMTLDDREWNNRAETERQIATRPASGAGASVTASAGAAAAAAAGGLLSSVSGFVSDVASAVAVQVNPSPVGSTAEAFDAVLDTIVPLPMEEGNEDRAVAQWSGASKHLECFRLEMISLATGIAELAKARRQAAEAMAKASKSSAGLGAPGDGGDTSADLSRAGQLVSEHMRRSSERELKNAVELEELVDGLDFFVGMAEASSEAVGRLNGALKRRAEARAALRAAEEHRETVVSRGGSGSGVSDAAQKLEVAQAVSQDASRRAADMMRVREEFRTAHQQRQLDMKGLALQIQRLQQEHAEGVQGLWARLMTDGKAVEEAISGKAV